MRDSGRLPSGRPEPHEAGASELAELLNLAFDAIFVRGFHDRTISYWNRGAEELYGWTREQALGRLPSDLLRSQYPIPLEEIEWELLATGRWEGRIVHFHRSGRQIVVAGRWVLRRDEQGEPLEILEINSDVTQAVRVEESLRASEERFRLIVERVRDYAIFMLDPQGVIASWNEGARNIKGYESHEVIGKHFSIFYPQSDVLGGKPARALETARREGVYEDEGWRVRKDGSLLWASVVMTALRDDAGVLRGFAKITRDLTRRRQEEERLREHAQRMVELEEAKANFLNLASHELRGPLTVIRGYLSMLSEGSLGHLNEIGQDVVPVLTQKSEEMAALIDQMLDVARMQDGTMRINRSQFDLRDLVSMQVEEARRLLAGPQNELDVRLPADPVLVDADRRRIGTILSNLLGNAIKYSPEGGLIRVAVGSDAEHARCTISDEGIGIATEDMDRLFTRFGRVVRSETSGIPGVGLGLYISRELARLHGGDIAVVSEADRGSTFTLTLPRG